MIKHRINLEREGAIDVENPKTIGRYREIMNQMNYFDTASVGIFFAFDNEQFERGYSGLVAKGFIKDGDKIARGAGGAFGVRGGFDKWRAFVDECRAKIREECDAQEVYFYEYNNHECMLSWEGDYNAMRLMIEIFGLDAAKKLKRYNAYAEIDAIARGEWVD